MSNKFKQQAAQRRAAVPQIDLERVKPLVPAAIERTQTPAVHLEPQPAASVEQVEQVAPPQSSEPALQRPKLTQVDTSETPVNRGFFMYPSRHRQVAKDLAYIEDRNPWRIIDDALEEYVVKHYGKEYKRKEK